MYEILGISLTSFKEIIYNPSDIVVDQNEFEDTNERYQDDDANDDSGDENSPQKLKEYNNELLNTSLERDKRNKMMEEKTHDEEGDEGQQVVKKPFLKRGAGLTNRFRIPPDAFNLKKLPRYKYQDRLQKTLHKQKGICVQEPAVKSKNVKKPVKKNAKPPIKIIEKQNVENLKVPESINLKVPKPELPPPPTKPLNLERVIPPPLQIEETPKVTKLPKGTSWAQILSSNNINDCSIDHLLNVKATEEEVDETNLFELIEERIRNLEKSPTSILNLLATLQNNQKEVDETLVNPDDPLIENPDAVCLHLKPQPSELGKKIFIDESESESEDEEEESNSNRVRFAENVEVLSETQEKTHNDSSILSTDVEAIELTQTSTPNERQKFEEFKLKVLGRQQQQDELKEKVDLLKLKLEDIEREKANIIQMRSNLELDRLQFENERDDLIGQLRDDRMKMEMELHDERIKFDEQKQKFDKLVRDAKNQSSKKEKEEIAKLKESIEELKEEMKSKEAKHASTSARYRTQIKQLEKENQTLKLELDVAKKENKRMELENARLKRDTSNKMLQEINKNIAKLVNPNPVEEKSKKVEPAKKPVTRRSITVTKPPEIIAPTTTSSSSESEDENTQGKSSETATSDLLSDMKREIVNSDGSKDIWYPNGNLKKISPDGMLIRMLYYNKDIKETNINEGTVRYYYADNNTWHTTYIDGLEILEYPK